MFNGLGKTFISSDDATTQDYMQKVSQNGHRFADYIFMCDFFHHSVCNKYAKMFSYRKGVKITDNAW